MYFVKNGYSSNTNMITDTVLSGIGPPEIRRSVHSQNERTKQLTDQRHSLHHHQPMNSHLHSRNIFVSTSQPLLCKPAEAHVSKWQERWEAPDSNLRKMTSTRKNDSRVVTHCRGGRPTECARDRPPPQQQNICGASGRAKTVCAAWPQAISATLWRTADMGYWPEHGSNKLSWQYDTMII